MFCGKCGTKNPDNARFCAGCGAPISIPKSVSIKPGVIIKRKNVDFKKYGLIVIALILVAVSVFVFGGRSYKSTVRQLFEAQFKPDAAAILDLLPEEVLVYALEESGYDYSELGDFVEEGNETLEYMIKQLDSYCGVGNWDADYEIASVEKISGYELTGLKYAYESMGVKISAAKNVELLINVNVFGEERSTTLDIAVIKIGRSWYLDVETMGDIF